MYDVDKAFLKAEFWVTYLFSKGGIAFNIHASLPNIRILSLQCYLPLNLYDEIPTDIYDVKWVTPTFKCENYPVIDRKLYIGEEQLIKEFYKFITPKDLHKYIIGLRLEKLTQALENYQRLVEHTKQLIIETEKY